MNSTINHEVVHDKNIVHLNQRCFSWSAVLVGALVGIGISFLLNLFGLGIGLSAYAHTTASTDSWAIGGFIGLLIIAIVSMSVLGWVAGYLGASKKLCYHSGEVCNHGCLYGFTAWCVALIFTILLAVPTAKFISYSLHTLNPTVVHEHGYKRMGVTTLNQTEQNSTTTSEVSHTTNNAVVADRMTDQEKSKALATTAFVSFMLFFVGAISATLAGHCGFNRYAKYERVEIE